MFDLLLAALERYFVSRVETKKMITQQKYEEHKRRARKNGRKREVRCFKPLDPYHVSVTLQNILFIDKTNSLSDLSYRY